MLSSFRLCMRSSVLALGLSVAAGCGLLSPTEEFLPEHTAFWAYGYADPTCSGPPGSASSCVPDWLRRIDLCPDGSGLQQVDDLLYSITYRIKHRTAIVTAGHGRAPSFILSPAGDTLTETSSGQILHRSPPSDKACRP